MDNYWSEWCAKWMDSNIDIIMADFNSKYTGEQVEEFLDQIANGEIGGGITAETDPIFSASPAASITEEKKAEWDGKQDKISDLDVIREGAGLGTTALQFVPSEYITEEELNNKGYATTSALNDKVDKVSGKQLSTEDFTTALKTKLEGLSNYDDDELSEALSTLRGDFDTLVSGDTTTAIKSFNDVIAFLDGIQDTQDLSSIIASIQQQIAGKMDKVTLATVATSGSYNDLSNKPTIPSEQVNADWNATSGKAQILNKPTIPSAVTESTVSGWGFTKNTGTYSKPSGGIPKTDLASDVQLSLSKANDALQEQRADEKYIKKNVWDDLVVAEADGIFSNEAGLHFALPNTNNGDEDDVLLSRESVKTINGESIFGSGDIDTRPYITNFSYEELQSIGNRQTGVQQELIEALREQRPILVPMSLTSDLGYYHASGYVEDLIYLTIYGDYGVVYYLEVDYTNSLELNPSNVIRKEFQNKLNSGTNIKTINGESILGSGDIEISGSSSSGGGEDIRYFTEFTVEQVVAAGSMLELSNGTSELYAAAENNKLICIPHQDGLNGFIVASYEVKLDDYGDKELYVSFIYGNVYYLMLVTPFMLDISKQPLLTHAVFVDSGIIDVYDNTNYVVTAPVTRVAAWPMDTLDIGSTIRFTTGEDCSISIGGDVKWVNGVIPTIESGVTYELSIIKQRIAGSFIALAVLTPFKAV